MGVPVYRTASTVPQYTDISVYRYTPTPDTDLCIQRMYAAIHGGFKNKKKKSNISVLNFKMQWET